MLESCQHKFNVLAEHLSRQPRDLFDGSSSDRLRRLQSNDMEAMTAPANRWSRDDELAIPDTVDEFIERIDQISHRLRLVFILLTS